MTDWFGVELVIVSTFLGAFGGFYLKKGSSAFNRNILLQLKNVKLLIGLFLYGLSSIFFIYGLRFEKLSLLYPITSLTYLWVSFLSIKFLNERMDACKVIGMTLIIIGVLLIVQ